MWDVAIAGGGPAGSAAALTLRDRYPDLSVCLVEASTYSELRVGEILPPAASTVLDHLGIRNGCRHAAHSVAVSWGHAGLVESARIFGLQGPGWHLDRARFDAELAAEAEARGVEVRRKTRVIEASETKNGWELRTAAGEQIMARFVIDATGRGALAARAAGARIVSEDRLIGYIGFVEAGLEEDPRMLVEAVEYGWWYTAAVEGGVRVIGCMTDADIGRELNLTEYDSWHAKLFETMHIRKARLTGDPVVRSASTQYLDHVCGETWMAAGDTAIAMDPLSGQGILAALRSGIYAAYALGDRIKGGDGSGLDRYQRFMDGTRAGYLNARQRYYAMEQRWPEHPFWRRRHRAEHGANQRKSAPVLLSFSKTSS